MDITKILAIAAICAPTQMTLQAGTVEKTVATTAAGTLKTLLPMNEWGAITDLTIQGPISESDLTFITNVAKATGSLENLDMSGASLLEVIGKGAFQGLKNLKSVSMPQDLKTIGDKAFMDCIGLEKVVLNPGLLTIEDRAFCNDSMMQALTLPSTLMDLNPSALNGCDNLTEIQVAPGGQNFSSIAGVLFTFEDLTLVKYPVARENAEYQIPDGTSGIAENAFQDSKLLTSVMMPASVKKIGKRAFANCRGLSMMIVGDGVTAIEDFAFNGCTGLTDISLPRTLKTVGDAMFVGCCKIASLRCEAAVPPKFSQLVSSPFVSEDASICPLNFETCVFSVPTKSVDKYKTAKGWSSFTNVEGFQMGK